MPWNSTDALLQFRHLRRRTARIVRRTLRIGPQPLADCGSAPAVRYQDRSYAGGEVSPDQARIEEALASFIGSECSLLHVGVGSSSLARRYASTLSRIDGITVLEDERAAGAALNLSNYTVHLCNKYGPDLAGLPGGYAVIVDNNPSSFACCRLHFKAMLRTYAALLAPGGVILTEQRGLAFSEPYAFGLSRRGWERCGRAAGLVPEPVTRTVYALRRPVR